MKDLLDALNDIPKEFFITLEDYMKSEEYKESSCEDCCYDGDRCRRLTYFLKDDIVDERIDKALDLCCDVLITSTGYPRYEKIMELRMYGFKVYRGDYDSFGWLTGIVEYPDGRQLVFG